MFGLVLTVTRPQIVRILELNLVKHVHFVITGAKNLNINMILQLGASEGFIIHQPNFSYIQYI